MAEYILAHDLGTSGNKATLFGTDGRLVGSCTASYEVYYDYPLWAEQDARDWWAAVCSSTKGLLAKCAILPEEIKAVSFSGQMMGCLPVDRQGNPLRRSIIWADQRAQAQAARLEERMDQETFYRLTGHRNTASYGIQKAMWVRDEEPEIYENTYKFLNAKDYCVYRLTGRFFTDCSDANGMACFDLRARDWSEELTALAGIDMDKLPQVGESITCVGTVTEQAGKETGLAAGTRVVIGAGDGVAANVGAGAIEPGKTYCCLGTSAWVAGTSEEPIPDAQRRIVNWAHAVPGLYSPNGSMQYAGGSYKWLKDTICLDEAARAREQGCSVYDIMDQEIAACAPGADGLLFLPHLLGERAPRWNPEAKGVFFGLTATTSRAQILRSVMEGVLMNLAICFDIFQRQSHASELMVIGGVARGDQWLRTIADLFGVTVKVPGYLEEANSMGAAVIAGVGSGIYKDFKAIDRFLEVRRKIEPDAAAGEQYRDLLRRYNALYDALLPIYQMG